MEAKHFLSFLHPPARSCVLYKGPILYATMTYPTQIMHTAQFSFLRLFLATSTNIFVTLEKAEFLALLSTLITFNDTNHHGRIL